MNKLFKRITGAIIGISAAVGFGAYVYNRKEEALSEYFGHSCAGDGDEPKSDAERRAKETVPTFYEVYVKRGIDIVLSLLGLIFLSPVAAIIALLIFVEDPGNVIFTQRRIGIHRSYFKLHKFRSMKLSTPKDVPTHLLENPDQYILKVGAFARKYSLDEIVQCFDILRGRMSIVGPRPALWNQDDLVAERERYGANDVRPGLTGWAQINGRDELEIPVKAAFDGQYVEELRKSSWAGFVMDLKCFFGTITSVLNHDGVVEGGTGELNRSKEAKNSIKKVLILVNHDMTIYNFRLELVERLIDEGYEVYISSPNGEKIDDLRALGCFYHEIKIDRHGMNPVKELGLVMTYFRLMGQIKPDIVLGYTIKPNIYGALVAGLKGIPFLANITGLGTAVENEGLSQKITLMLYKIAFRKVNRIYFQNEENMQFFANRNIYPDRYELLPGSGVNLTRFPLQTYPSDSHGIRFAFLSRIMKEKGIEEYLGAAQVLKTRYPDAEFHICGFCEEGYEENLKKLEEAGIITCHGMIRDVAGFLKDMHCVVLPSYHEGMSNVLLEGSATGRPIITTDCAGCREIVDDGVNGYMVPVQDTQALVIAMDKFIKLSQMDRKLMGLKARTKVEQEFDREIVVRTYVNAIENLIY